MYDIEMILKALDFAAKRHSAQFRKGEDKSPYINHPIQVANLLINEAGEQDPFLLTAAILHDVVEDTVNTKEDKQKLIDQISEIFGEQVLTLVMEVTDDKSLEKAERKRLQIEQASYKSDNARKLKIADKIMNIRDITNHPPVDWDLRRILDYFDWAEKVVAGLRGVNRELEDIFDECLTEARGKYRKLKMEEHVKLIFRNEFSCIEQKFNIISMSINEAFESKNELVAHPGVYVFWHEGKIIKVGRHLINSRKRALEHIRDNTKNEVFQMNALKTCSEECGLTLINCIDKKDYHWAAAIEVFLENVLDPVIRSKRTG